MAMLSEYKRFFSKDPEDWDLAEKSFNQKRYCECTVGRLAKSTPFGKLCVLCNLIINENPIVKNLQQEMEEPMDSKQFEAVFHYITGKCQSILLERAHRYAYDSNRLRNFYNVAKEQDLPVHRIPTLFSAKQREAFTEALKFNVLMGGFQLDMWEEWIVDQINYLILTYAILKEESKNASTDK